jgi:hypothetical protein
VLSWQWFRGGAAPAWTVTSGLLSRVVPSSEAGLRFLGALDTLLVALGATVVGPSSWSEWTAHIRRHAAVASMNKAGLGTVVSFDPAYRVERVQARSIGATTDVWTQRWSDGVRARRPWIGLTLALLFAPIATELSGYYLMLFVLAGVLASARAWLERWLLGFSAAVQVLMLMPAVGWFYDDRYLAISLAYVAAPVGLRLVFARRRDAPARVTPGDPPGL